MTALALTAACQPDAAAEWDNLASLLAPGTMPRPLAQLAPLTRISGCAVLGWARSGLMQLTGLPAGPPLTPRAPVLLRATQLAVAISELASQHGSRVNLDLAGILSSRAALYGWHGQGTTSVNGSCRLLRA